MAERLFFYYTLFFFSCIFFTSCSAQISTAPSHDDVQRSVGWQANPNRRGTLNIIESCGFTVLACTWSIQHLNIPDSGECWWTKMRRKIKWTTLAILFPELLTAHAVVELYMAVMATVDYANRHKLGSINNISLRLPWWFYALRLVQSTNGDEERNPRCHAQKRGQNDQETMMEWTLTHSYYAIMGGFHLYEEKHDPSRDEKNLRLNRDLPGDESNNNASAEMLLPLSPTQLANNWENIMSFKISEAEIKDKSKADFFTKALASVQILYLVISITARAIRHLAFTQLELVTVAFAVCGVSTYAFRWYKPQGVETGTNVWLFTKREDCKGLGEQQFDRIWDILRTHERDVWPHTSRRIPNDYLPHGLPQRVHPFLFLLAAITVAFGGMHLIAWNFEFPTLAEKIAWRSAALASTCLPSIVLLVVPVFNLVHARLVGNDTRDFIRACLYAMKEFSWEVPDNEPLKDSYKLLERVYDDPDGARRECYGDIFNWNGPEITKVTLLEFIKDRKKNFPDEYARGVFPRDFDKRFSELIEVIDGKQNFKYLEEADRTDRFPPKRSQWPSIVITAVGIAYCLARLCIVVLACSTLREMPDSVYETVWTNVLPNVQ